MNSASIASCLRLHALYIVSISQDITWDNPGTATWSSMELNIGIICASLPTLRALLAKHFPGTFSSSRYSNGRPGYRGSRPSMAKQRIIGDKEIGVPQNNGSITHSSTSDNEDEKSETAPHQGNIVLQTEIDVDYANRSQQSSPSPITALPRMVV